MRAFIRLIEPIQERMVNSMESNKKPVIGPEERLQTVISELDTTVDDFLEKGKFALMELIEVAAVHADDTPDIRTRNLNRANTLADITHDYLTQAQSVITSIVLQESKAWAERSDPELAECGQKIMRNIQQIKNPALLEKIQTFVKCRMENEGGKADE